MKTTNITGVTYADILKTNKAYKEQSLFSILNFLNKDAKTLEMLTALNIYYTASTKAGDVQKVGLTIDRMKALCPDYFKINSKDEDGNLIIIDRVLFTPYPFLKAIYKLYKSIC